jgi:phosphohistidine swiveling domain-containing protein
LTKAEKAAKVIAKGLPAGPGAASGKMYLNADRADAAAAKGEKVLLVRNETTPEDLRGMIASEGILTAKGGVSSHAALVARQMGKVCVCGAGALQIDYAAKTLTADPARRSRKAISSPSTARSATFMPASSRLPLPKLSRCSSRNRSTARRARPTGCLPR